MAIHKKGRRLKDTGVIHDTPPANPAPGDKLRTTDEHGNELILKYDRQLLLRRLDGTIVKGQKFWQNRDETEVASKRAYRQKIFEVMQDELTPETHRKCLNILKEIAFKGKGKERIDAIKMLNTMMLGKEPQYLMQVFEQINNTVNISSADKMQRFLEDAGISRPGIEQDVIDAEHEVIE